MTVIATKTKADLLSHVLMMDQYDQLGDKQNYAHKVVAQETGATDYVVGQVLYYDTDHWRILVAGDFTANVLNAAVSGKETKGHPLAIVVGDAAGIGHVDALSLEAATNTEITVVFGGGVNVKEAGLVFDAGVTGADLAAALVQLASQDVNLHDVATGVATKYYGV